MKTANETGISFHTVASYRSWTPEGNVAQLWRWWWWWWWWWWWLL